MSNHYKDSVERKPSELIILKKESFAVERRIPFKSPFYHIGGLASDGNDLYAVDFDNNDVLKIDLEKSVKEKEVSSKTIFKITVNGASGLSIIDNLIAVSDYIVPYRSPYFSDRYIRFFDLKSGSEVFFNGKIKSSNYSQGLTFFKSGNTTFLIESINQFDSVLKYWITDLDSKPDLIRIYRIDIESKKIEHISDSPIAASMVEDLAWDGSKNLFTTDEQNFHFYKGTIQDCL